MGPDFAITALSGGHEMDDDALLLGAVPYVLM